MHRQHKYIQLFIFIVFISFTLQYEHNPFQEISIPKDMMTGVTIDFESKLYKRIFKKSKQINEDPQDAYIDRVWKKTPGRNGLRVNIEESYKNMKKKNTFNEDLLVIETIPPKVHLSDLPASPIYRGHPEKEMVAFLINVSWGTEYLPTILQTLKEHKVKATFFIEGKWAKENPQIVKMIAEQNHTIGNHAYNHPDMSRMSKEKIYEQIHETNNIIEAILGKKPKWFAPPSGSYNDQVVEVAYSLEMETILWTVDTIDWRNPSVPVMVNRVLTKVHPGATILMHPTEPVAKGLNRLIQEIKERNYKIGTIDQLLSSNR